MPTEDPMVGPSDQDAGTGLSRRGLLRGAAGIGVAGVAAGLLVSEAGTAAAATTSSAAQSAPGAASASTEPLVAHMRNAQTGEFDVYVGTRHVRFRDPELAARLARAAR